MLGLSGTPPQNTLMMFLPVGREGKMANGWWHIQIGRGLIKVRREVRPTVGSLVFDSRVERSHPVYWGPFVVVGEGG